MTFRQNEIFVKQFLWSSGLLTMVMAALFLRDRELLLPLLACTGLVLGPGVHAWRTEPMVTVDEVGVRCRAGEKRLWELAWEEIAQVRRITRFGSPAALMIPGIEPKQDLHTPQAAEFLGFQLSRKARAALEKFCPGYRK